MAEQYGELANVLAPARRAQLEKEISRSRNPIRRQTFQQMLDRESSGQGPMGIADKQNFRQGLVEDTQGLPPMQMDRVRDAMNRGRGLDGGNVEQRFGEGFRPDFDVDRSFNAGPMRPGSEIDRGFDPSQVGPMRPGSGQGMSPGLAPKPQMSPEQAGLERARARVRARAGDREDSGGNIGGRMRGGGLSFGGNQQNGKYRFL